MANEPTPEEVASITLKILTLVNEHVATTSEVLAAALKCAGVVVEETRAAHFGAQLRASMVQQYGKRP